jgi:lysophospholipase L1-like esterase
MTSSQSFHPYTIRLGELLSKKLPKTRITFTNTGIGGAGIQDLVASEVHDMSHQHFDLVIFMAGINDVKWRLRQADPVFQSLLQLYKEVVEKTGAAILAVPPLPTKLCGYQGAW